MVRGVSRARSCGDAKGKEVRRERLLPPPYVLSLHPAGVLDVCVYVLCWVESMLRCAGGVRHAASVRRAGHLHRCCDSASLLHSEHRLVASCLPYVTSSVTQLGRPLSWAAVARIRLSVHRSELGTCSCGFWCSSGLPALRLVVEQRCCLHLLFPPE